MAVAVRLVDCIRNRSQLARDVGGGYGAAYQEEVLALEVFGLAVAFRVLDPVGVGAFPGCESGDGGDAGRVVVP